MLLNCGVGEDSWEFLGLQDQRLLRVPWTARFPRGNQSWIFIGRTDDEVLLWPPDANNWLTGKDPDAGKEWRQEKGTEDDSIDKVWASSASWWWTREPGALQSMGLQTWLADRTESPSLFNPFFSPYHPCPHPICVSIRYHANSFIYIILLDYTYVHVIFAYSW